MKFTSRTKRTSFGHLLAKPAEHRVRNSKRSSILLAVLLLTQISHSSLAENSGQETVLSSTPLISVPLEIKTGPLPDLVVPADSLVLDPTAPFVGRTVFIACRLANLGETSARNPEVTLYFQRPDEEKKPITNLVKYPPPAIHQLAPGEEIECRFRWDTIDNPGSYKVIVTADPKGEIMESNEHNNDSTVEIEIAPDYQELTYEANALFVKMREKFQQVIEQIEARRAWAPGDPLYFEANEHHFLAYAHYMLGDHSKTRRLAREGMKVFPGDCTLSYLLASTAIREGSPEEAIEWVENARERSTYIEDSLMVRLLHEQGQPQKGYRDLRGEQGEEGTVPLLREVTKRFPGSPYGWIYLGIALQKIHKDLEACDAFEKGFQLANSQFYVFENHYLLVNWVQALQATGRNKEAFEIATEGVNIFENPHELEYLRVKLGHETEALKAEECMKALDALLQTGLTPFWKTRICYQKGTILQETGDTESARKWFEESLEYTADFNPSLQALGQMGQ